MEINLKDQLRTLRQQKNITQETLAKHLGITPQSVGKWERGEGFPDITLLPQIALYFCVSIDTLLGVDKIQIENTIKAYLKESTRLMRGGETEKNIALWEAAAKEFPNDHRVMAGWMGALAARGIWPCPREDADTILALGERILEESTDIMLREAAIQTLCHTLKSMGDEVNALRYAKMGGSIDTTREDLSAFVLEGEAGVKATQEYILSLINHAALAASLLPSKTTLCAAQEVKAYQFGIDLLKLLFSDDNVGFYANELSRLYSCIARVYAKEGNSLDTLAALSECVRYARMSAKTECDDPFGTAASSYTAPMVNRLEHIPAAITKNYSGNACDLRLNDLMWDGYDFIRKTEIFGQLTKELGQKALHPDKS